MNQNLITMLRQVRVLLHVVTVLSCLAAMSLTVKAQAPYYEPSAKVYTPLTEQPGAPAGSYPLSGFDHVNLFNGHLSFSLPLMKIGGRGKAGYTMMLPIEQHWQVLTVAVPTCDWSGCSYPESNYRYIANPIWWDGIRPGFSPGVLQGRQGGTAPGNWASGCSTAIYQKTLTRLTFTAPDGTENELRDVQTGGQPVQGGGCYGGPSRGKVFVTADGSAMTFVSDADIYDDRQPHTPNVFYPSGYLMFRDGTRYRIDNGKVTWIRDNNGNKVSFTYSGNDLMGIDDSLNRHVSISGGAISFKGANGVTRTLTVHSAPLSTALRTHPDGSTEYTIKTFAQLFSFQNPQNGTFDIPVTTAVELPDGRQYQFRYDSYANLAQVILPTGGRIDYDWTTSSYLFGDHVYGVYNQVNDRRTALSSSATTYETHTHYSVSGTTTSGPTISTVDTLDPNNGDALITRTKHYFNGYWLMSPDPLNPYPGWANGKEYQTEFFAADGVTVLRRVNNTYRQRAAVGWYTGSADFEPPNDPRLVEVTTTLVDTNQVSKVTSIDPANPTGPVGYDQYNNQTKVWEYDFGSGAPGPLLRQTVTSYLTSGYDTLIPNSSTPNLSLTVHIRSLPTQISVYDAGGVERARSSLEYDNYTNGPPNHAPLVSRASISGFDSTFSSSYTTRGNVTAATSSLLTNGSVTGSLTSYSQYDIAGNLVKSIDARGFATDFDFSDHYGTADGDARANASPPELGSATSYAFATKVTNALGHQAYIQLDYYLGTGVDSEDSNGAVTSVYFNDALDRPTQVKRGVGTSLLNQTTFSYDDVGRIITTNTDLDANTVLVSKSLYDGFGRTIESRTYEGGTNYIAVKQVPFAMLQDPDTGAFVQARQSSNPYRPYLNEQPVWNTTFFDALGRSVKIRTPDNAIFRTTYAGNTVTVTDQAGKTRKSVSDALGRLLTVYEDPAGLNYQTSYAYDVLNDLITITQGTQTRSFAYDSIKRLASATNPESGTSTYQYDNNSNLIQKTDARGIVSLYTYDALNRNTTIDYSDTSSINPDVSRFYDGATNGKGRIWYSYAGGTESAGSNVEKTLVDSYDTLGRPLIIKQLFKVNGVWSAPYQVSRVYNLAGNVTGQTYPSGHSVTYNYDSADRLADKDAQNLAFTGNLGDGLLRTYSRGMSYAPGGQLSQEQFGTITPVYNKLFYNSRQQLAEILASTAGGDSSWNRGKIVNDYSLQCAGAGCNATDNNGNLRKQETYIPANDQVSSFTSWYQQYDYDALNRLLRVHEYTGNPSLDWQQEYVYDRWGNRTIHQTNTFGAGINKKDFTVNTANNQLGVPVGQSGVMSYDAVGNLTADTYTGFGNRVYDADNRMTAAQDNTGVWAYYTYNADGERTRRKSNNQETWQVFGFGGELLAEYAANAAASQPNKEYGYRNGQLLITAEAGAGSAPPVFADDFNDNSLNPASWTAYGPGTPTVSEQSQQLQITLAPNTAGYNGVYSNSTYNLTGKMVQLESAQAVSQAGWCENFFEVELDANNYFMIQVGAGNMIFRSRVNGVNDQTSIAFDGVANRYWRIRHDQSANLIYFETSADSSVWLTRKTVTPGFSLTSLRFDLLAGAYGTGNSSPGAAKYDNFKLITSTASTSLTVPNAGFESPVLGTGNWQYAPTGGSWSFANGGGISGINSAFTGVPSAAPEGVQVAVIQAYGTISQSISGFQSNTNYVITFKAIQRTNCCNTGGQDIGVYVDDVLVGSFHPSASAYVEYSTPAFSTSTGAHTVKFAGLNLQGGDQSAFIDNVRITGSPKPGFGVQWLLTDQLGTPRMVFDESGALANVKRHDYLPFGEELLATQGLRSTTIGYSATDGVRQQFTQQERDGETGLDYFGARYYSSTQGRFTSPDLFGGRVTNPKTLNLYTYVTNNPLKLIDPTGHWPQDPEHKDDVVRIEIHDHWYNHVWQSIKGWFGGGGKSQPKKSDGLPEPVPSAHPTPTPAPVVQATPNPLNQNPSDDPRFWTFFIMAASAGAMPVPGDSGEGGLEETEVMMLDEALTEAEIAGATKSVVNPTAGTKNCVNCAVAGDATLAGRPASAMPGTITTIDQLEKMFSGKFAPVSSPAQIEQQLINAGPGSRGIVFVSNPGTQPGHVFNAVNQGGRVNFVDFQTGGQGNFGPWKNISFMRTN